MRGGGEIGDVVLSALAQAEAAHFLVVPEGQRPQDFGERAGPGAAHEVHFEQAVAGVEIAKRFGGVRVRGGADEWDAVRVEGDGDGRGEAGEGKVPEAAGRVRVSRKTMAIPARSSSATPIARPRRNPARNPRCGMGGNSKMEGRLLCWVNDYHGGQRER